MRSASTAATAALAISSAAVSAHAVIDDEAYLYRAAYYVVENPVRAGHCERWEDWPWSYLSPDLRS
jgi:REP element-mobilizing transposase RayT